MSDKDSALLGIKKLRWLCLTDSDSRLVSRLLNAAKLTICVWRLKLYRSSPVSMCDDMLSMFRIAYTLIVICMIITMLAYILTLLSSL